ncbi:mg583 protein [Tupanvirus deep ocean]|uniref:Mg583 protein n=2 Tax=Tupanvirus TaxID=2094720 RepID=A0AC62A7R8_9VIRU|nr:mg583 protein [Tupanvirus deep ocean]QKU33830.1 mg583 protein [Tupanvirus deep ocean]
MAETENKNSQDYYTETDENKQKDLENESKENTNEPTSESNNENNDAEELEKLLKQKQELDEIKRQEEEEEKELKKKLEQHIEDVRTNLAMFSKWMKNKKLFDNLYKDFCNDFSPEYRSELFENVCEFFKDESFVTDDILFYWKHLVVHLLKTSKKYKYYLQDLVFDHETHDTNLRLVREKYIFKCFIGEEQLCYFKENGTDYYVS